MLHIHTHHSPYRPSPLSKAGDAKAQVGPTDTPEPEEEDDHSDAEDVTGLYSGLEDISSALQAMWVGMSVCAGATLCTHQPTHTPIHT